MAEIKENKVLLISAYELDENHGSEPNLGYHLVQQAITRFKKTIVITSDLTNPIVLDALKEMYKEKIEIHNVRVKSLSWSSHPVAFYPIYREWQKDVGRFLRKNQIEFELGIHASLGTFLFGTGFSMYTKPYIYGPAGFSFFNIAYSKAYGWKSTIEIIRNILVYGLLICDPFVRNSLINAEAILAGDKLVSKKLKGIYPNINLVEKPVPHVQIPDFEVETNDSESMKLDLIWTGRFISRKDPLFALEVFREILFSCPDAKLTMIGEGKLRNKIEKYLRKNHLSYAVNLTGWVDKNAVMSMMRNANLMLFTSFRETAGVQIFECNNVGTRVVSLDATGAASWYKHELIDFISIDFLESRKSLVRKYSLQALKMRDCALRQTTSQPNQIPKKVLLEEILLATSKI